MRAVPKKMMLSEGRNSKLAVVAMAWICSHRLENTR